MLKGFEHLSPAEVDALIETPVLITILIGAADGNLDKEERYWSDRLMQVRTYAKPKMTVDFYRIVADGFLEKVDATMSHLPTDVEHRSEVIKGKLQDINPIMEKLDVDLAAALYKSFIGLSNETAKASGGFLRMGSVSAAEYKWVELPMLQVFSSSNPETDETVFFDED